MKKYAFIVLMAGMLLYFADANAQTDTLIRPDRTFKDPKITDDNSRVLIDTTTNIDSLLDKSTRGKHKTHFEHPPAGQEQGVRPKRTKPANQ